VYPLTGCLTKGGPISVLVSSLTLPWNSKTYKRSSPPWRWPPLATRIAFFLKTVISFSPLPEFSFHGRPHFFTPPPAIPPSWDVAHDSFGKPPRSLFEKMPSSPMCTTHPNKGFFVDSTGNGRVCVDFFLVFGPNTFSRRHYVPLEFVWARAILCFKTLDFFCPPFL